MKKIKWFLILGLLPLLMPILVILILASAMAGGSIGGNSNSQNGVTYSEHWSDGDAYTHNLLTKSTPAPTVAPTPAPTIEKAPAPSYSTGEASPAAKKILSEKQISPNEIKGTGKGGRITKEDALNAQPARHSMGTPTNGKRTEKRAKLSMLRRKVAERLVSAKNETAMLTTFNEVDMSAIYEIRNEYKDVFKEKHNVGLGFMSFFTLAVVRALKLFPDVNSMIDDKEKITYEYCDISIAVSGPKGLC